MSALYAPAESIWLRVLPRLVVTDAGCWEWQGATNSRGYGCVSAGKSGKTVLTHRLAVIVRDGSIPDDLPIDHLCRNIICANPDHLEVVTTAENNRRSREARGYMVGGQCGDGHPLTEATTYRHASGRLVCKACVRKHRTQHLLDNSHPYRVRQWAKAVGLHVGERGRIPRAVLAAYEAAHRQAAA